jgi:basic membrane lipoprotein Med (substrate-binding protein (PBP1-ABC) superfamily)
MKNTTVLFSILLLAAATASAGGGGGGGGQGQGSGQGQGQGSGLGGGQGQQQGQGGTQAGRGDMDQQRVHATKEQRDQIRTCSKQADEIRQQARKMTQTSAKKFNADEARQQRDQIQTQLRAMEQEHERLMNGLDPNQQQALQEQIQNMNRLRQQTRSEFQQMNSELEPANPDAARVKERAREMEQTMKDWSKEYQTLHSQTQE